MSKSMRPSPTERRIAMTKLDSSIYDWIDNEHWSIKITKSKFLNQCARFAFHHKDEFKLFCKENDY